MYHLISLLIFLFSFLSELAGRQKTHHLQKHKTAVSYFKHPLSHPIITVHRMTQKEKGFSENARATFLYNLYNNPFTIQEIDIRMTTDQKLVLLHDSTLERTTTGTRIRSRLKWEKVCQYELKNKYGMIPKRQHIPTLYKIPHINDTAYLN